MRWGKKKKFLQFFFSNAFAFTCNSFAVLRETFALSCKTFCKQDVKNFIPHTVSQRIQYFLEPNIFVRQHKI